MNLSPKSRSKILNLLIIFAVTVTIIGLVTDLKNTLNYGGIDLRNRVVGARVLIEGLDPYFFKWHQGMSDKLLDPLVKPNSITSRVTVPPTVLILHSTIAGFSYLQQKIIWLIVQWVALLSTLIIFNKKSDSSLKQNLIIILGWFFFNSLFWHLHVERGQIYIIYVFLLSLAWFFSQESFKYHDMLSGFLVGLTASLRLPLILMFIPFLIYRKWKLLFGSIVGLISSLFLSLTLANFSIWQSYFIAMSGITKLIDLQNHSLSARDFEEPSVVYPEIIEGMSNLHSMINLPRINSSFEKILNILGINDTSNFLIFSLFIIILLISFFLLSLAHKNVSINLIFLSGIVMYLICEFFIPSPRDSYNEVQWILPLSLIIVEADIQKLLANKLIFLLLFNLPIYILLPYTGCCSWIPRFLSLLSIILMTLYVALTSLLLIKQDAKELS